MKTNEDTNNNKKDYVDRRINIALISTIPMINNDKLVLSRLWCQ